MNSTAASRKYSFMRKTVSKFALAACFSLALAFTFSCSNGGGGSSSSASEQKFVAEIGTVCVAYANLFPEPLDNKYVIADGTTNYIHMQSVCGDKSESYIIGTSTEVTNWLNLRNLSTAMFDAINKELFAKNNSAFLGVYPAVDGYLRYLYVELVGDGKGLAKSLAREEK